MDDLVITEKVRLYKNILMCDYITNTFLNLLFHSFNLMFRKHAVVRSHGLPNTYYYLTNSNNSNTDEHKLNDFKIHLYASDDDTFCFDLELNGTVVKDKTQFISFTTTSPDLVIEFINSITKNTLDEYIEMASVEKIPSNIYRKQIIDESLIVTKSEKGFMKKIKGIKEIGNMFKYLIHFDDDSTHNVITPDELPPYVKVGDFVYLDEHNNFNFISKTLIQ